MSIKRIILAIVFPPFAIADKGCGEFLLTFFLTCLGWIPGIICALVILKLEQRKINSSNQKVNKLKHKSSKSKAASPPPKDNSAQSAFNRKRRMTNRPQSDNSTNSSSQGWQGW